MATVIESKRTAAPWEPEASWSKERREAFLLYRDLGFGRSLESVGRELGKSEGLIERWSSEDEWVRRTTAYDGMIAAARADAAVTENERIARKHAAVIEKAIDVLSKPALDLAEAIERGEVNGSMYEGLSNYERFALTERLAKVLPSLVQASRLVRGVSTENVDHLHRVRLDRASDADLDAKLTGLDSIIEGHDA